MSCATSVAILTAAQSKEGKVGLTMLFHGTPLFATLSRSYALGSWCLQISLLQCSANGNCNSVQNAGIRNPIWHCLAP